MNYIEFEKDGFMLVRSTETCESMLIPTECLGMLQERGYILHTVDAMDCLVHFVGKLFKFSCGFRCDDYPILVKYFGDECDNVFAGVKRSLAKSLKSEYLTLKRMGVSVNLESIFFSKDMLLEDLRNLYLISTRPIHFRPNLELQCESVASRWGLSVDGMVKQFC